MTITYDGTWSKRGFTAQYGVGVVGAWDAGSILDTHVLSKYCGACAKHRAELDSDEFQQWYETHKACCRLKHIGSSPSMEAAAAALVFEKRSRMVRV